VWWNKTQEVKAEGITKPNLAWMVQGREEGEELVACQVANEKESQGGRRRRGDMEETYPSQRIQTWLTAVDEVTIERE
jgi:hypothetical protein